MFQAVVQDFAYLRLSVQAEDPLVLPLQDHLSDPGQGVAVHVRDSGLAEGRPEGLGKLRVRRDTPFYFLEEAVHVLLLPGHTGGVGRIFEGHTGSDELFRLFVSQGESAAFYKFRIDVRHIFLEGDLHTVHQAVQGADVLHIENIVAVNGSELAEQEFDRVHLVLCAHLLVGAVPVGGTDLLFTDRAQAPVLLQDIDGGDGVTVDLDAAPGPVCVVEDHQEQVVGHGAVVVLAGSIFVPAVVSSHKEEALDPVVIAVQSTIEVEGIFLCPLRGSLLVIVAVLFDLFLPFFYYSAADGYDCRKENQYRHARSDLPFFSSSLHII